MPLPSEISKAVDIQCVQVKKEIYKLKPLLDQYPHHDVRQRALEMFEQAYNAFQALQSFIISR